MIGVFILLSALTLIASRIIKQEKTIAKIQAGASQAVNGQVNIQKTKLALLPWPHIVLDRASFSIPETAEGTMASLALYPRLLPLLTGQFRCARITVKAPDITIKLPAKRALQEKKPKPLSLDRVKANLGTFLGLISENAPGLVITIKNGRLNFVKANTSSLEVKDILARIAHAPETVNLNIRCTSDRWQRMSLKGSLQSVQDQVALTLTQLKLEPLGINLSGKLTVDHSPLAPSPAIDLEIKGQDVDVLAARKVALDLAGNTATVRDIFDVLKGGRVPWVTFTSHGNSPADLGELKNINIQGRLQNGDIFVPNVNLDLTHVNGDVMITKGVLQGNNLEARLQNSQGRLGTLRLGLAEEDGRPFHLDVTIDADLAQLPSVLTSLIDNEDFVRELALVKKPHGRATGRLIMGERLASFDTVVEVSGFNLSADYRRLPYRLDLHGGQFAYKNNKVILKNISGRMSRSSFDGLALDLDLKATPRLDVTAGQSTLFMDEVYPWLTSYDALKDKLQNFKIAKGVLSLSNVSLQGPVQAPEQWHLRTTGDLVLDQGLTISADLAANPDKLSINNLVIKDKGSNALITLTSANRALGLSFQGNVNQATLDNLLRSNRILEGSISGDFHAHVLFDQPVKSSAQGTLQIRNLIVPWPKPIPLVVNNLALEAKEDHLWVESAGLTLAGDRLDLKGNVDLLADSLNFEVDLAADNLNVDRLKQALGKKPKAEHDQTAPKGQAHGVQGHIKLNAAKMTFKGLKWSPFYANVAIKDDTATVTVTEANLCGIATPGVLEIAPQKISLDAKPTAQNRPLYSTIHCFLDQSVKVDGNFDFNGNITAQGTNTDLLGALNGSFNFTAAKGRFYSGRFHGIIARIVSLLSLTEIFRGKLPDIGREGFGYNSIKAKADIRNGNIRLNEMIIDGRSMNITVRGGYDLTHEFLNCVALVSPLKTIDAVFQKIPVVKDVLGSSLVSIPYGIKGHPDDLKITRLSPSEVDSELLGIMQRTLPFPVHIIQPVIPEAKQK